VCGMGCNKNITRVLCVYFMGGISMCYRVYKYIYIYIFFFSLSDYGVRDE